MTGLRRLLSELVHPLFLFLDFLGAALIAAAAFVTPTWHVVALTLGSTFLTIGITLPAATFFQSLQNEQAFKILNSCNHAGVQAVFTSRKSDSGDLRKALISGIVQSHSISFLGVAFRSFFDPSGESREVLARALNTCATSLRVLVLDPDSDSAHRRDRAERSKATIDDIRHTISNGLNAVITERLRQIKQETSDWPALVADRRALLRRLNIGIRVYSTEPVALVMMFDQTMFSEQYHRGRPPELVPAGSCIGKYVPVLQYRKGSNGYRFLECHFEAIWEESRDITETQLEHVLADFS